MTPEVGTTIKALRKKSTRELIQLAIDLREELATFARDPYMPSARREMYEATLEKAAQVMRERNKVSATTAAEA